MQGAGVDPSDGTGHRIGGDVGMAGQQVVGFRGEQSADVARHVTVGHRDPFAVELDDARPTQASRTRLGRGDLQFPGGVVVAENEPERERATDPQNRGADEIPAVDERRRPGIAQQVHRPPGAGEFIVGVGEDSDEHGSD